MEQEEKGKKKEKRQRHERSGWSRPKPVRMYRGRSEPMHGSTGGRGSKVDFDVGRVNRCLS